MEHPLQADITQLLAESRNGDSSAWRAAVSAIYAELHVLAKRNLRGVDAPTMGATGLVHECYLKLMRSKSDSPESRAHFLNLASRIMRQILCDYSRERLAQKRGGGAIRGDTLDMEQQADSSVEALRLIQVDEALKQLEVTEPRWSRVVECRFFAGLSAEETAEALDLTLRTVQRDWEQARHWLANHLQ